MISVEKYLSSALIALCIPSLSGCGGESSTAGTAGQVSAAIASTPTPTPTATTAGVQQLAATTSTLVTAVTTEILLKTYQKWIVPLMKLNGGVAVRIKGTVEGATIGPVRIEGPKYAIYTEAGAVIRNLTITDFEAVELQREGIRLRGDVNQVAIKNFGIHMRAQPQVSPDLPMGIALYEGSNISLSDGKISGFKMVYVPGTYTNGDGVASERPVDSLLIERVTSTDNSDAGFDLKSTNTFLYDTRAERNKRNYRFWGTVAGGTVTSVDPVIGAEAAHMWVAKGAEVVIDKLVASSANTAPVLWIEPDAKSVTVKSCQLNVPAGTKFFIGGKYTVKNFGPGCSL